MLAHSFLYRIFKLPRVLNPIFYIGGLIKSITQPLDIWTIFLFLKILISKEWSIKFSSEAELQLNKVNTSDTEAPFLNFHLSISNGLVSSKIHDKHDNFPFLDGDVPCQPSYGVYFSTQKICKRFCV